ncbi:MAG: spore maturation protein [Clostridia bacterium]|nr:spore maturation protein [Clostridia bacterium]
MNIFWLMMMLASIFVLLITSPGAVLSSMISASTDALSLCIELCAVYCVWLGIVELVEASGLGEKLAKFLSPVIKKIFKVEDKTTQKLIAMNISANMLGIGNASTPMGIKAMQALDDGSGKANFAMIMLIVINATSIQLLPTTVIGLRASAGAATPADIILPTLIVTFATTALGIFLVHSINKIISRKKRKNQ